MTNREDLGTQIELHGNDPTPGGVDHALDGKEKARWQS